MGRSYDLTCKCGKKAVARGLCRLCYNRHAYNGALPPTNRAPNKKSTKKTAAFTGTFTKVRIPLTREDALGQRGSAHS